MVKEKTKIKIFGALNLALILIAAAFLIGNWANISNANNFLSQNFATGMAVSAPSVTGNSVYTSQACNQLAAYWTFDNVAAMQTDALGNKGEVYTSHPFGPASGEKLRASFAPGKNGNAIFLNYINSTYFLINGTTNTLNWGRLDSFTYEFWIKTSSANGTILSQTHTEKLNPKIDILIGVNDSGNSIGAGRVFAVIVDDNGNKATLNSSIAINDDQWHHIALVRSAQDRIKLIIDGNQVAAANDAFNTAITTDYYRAIGFENKWFDRQKNTILENLSRIDAWIDEFAVWNRALEISEINAHLDGQKYCDVSKIPSAATPSTTTGQQTCASQGGEVFNIREEKCLGLLDKEERKDYKINVPIGTTEMPTVEYACCNKTIAKVYVPYNPATENCPENRIVNLKKEATRDTTAQWKCEDGWTLITPTSSEQRPDCSKIFCEKAAKTGKTGCENLGGKPYFAALQTCSSTDTSSAATAGLKAGYGCCKVTPENKSCEDLGGSTVIDSTKSKCSGGSVNVIYPILGLSKTELCCKTTAVPKTKTGTCSELGYTRCNKTAEETCRDDQWIGARDDDQRIDSGMHCCMAACVPYEKPTYCSGVTMNDYSKKCSGKVEIVSIDGEDKICCQGTLSERTTSTLTCEDQGGEQFDNTAQFCYGGSVIPAKDSSGTIQCCSGVRKLNSERFIFGATEGAALTTQGTGSTGAGGLCLYQSRSYGLGQRSSDGKYCDRDGQMKNMKEKDAACSEHYECKSNACYNGQCTDVRTTLSLIPRIWCWLKSWIAYPTDVESREGEVCECLADYGNAKTLEPDVC